MAEYYLIAQLPSLDGVGENMPVPITEERFLELCCRFLDSTVSFCYIGIVAKKISEYDMSSKLVGVLGANIQMMCHQMRFVGIFERISAFDSEVSLVDISNLCKPLDNNIEHRIIFDDNVKIDARLCEHSLN